jgi:two-component system chemotaxis response regulator CheB
MSNPLRILVVDDTVVYRKIIADLLSTVPGVEVIGTAASGGIALQKIEQFHPDLLTLDLEMPQMDGLEVLRRLKGVGSKIGVIMLSAFTSQGAQSTLSALELGAFDFVLKPSTSSIEESTEYLRQNLISKIQAYTRTKHVRDILNGAATSKEMTVPTVKSPAEVVRNMTKVFSALKEKPEVIAIGISTGGPQALATMIPELPIDLGLPILIVQHMPPLFTKSLADSLNEKAKLTVCEAQDGQILQPNWCYIAPGGKQMKIKSTEKGNLIKITDDPPENSCKPSVDYLFRSVALTYGPRAMGVIMTGMGSDGTLGCQLLKRNGATLIAQDEATCVVYGMPKGPIESGWVDIVSPLSRIAENIVCQVRQERILCR